MFEVGGLLQQGLADLDDGLPILVIDGGDEVIVLCQRLMDQLGLFVLFQQASGGIESYSGFWSTIASATPSNVQADPNAMTVSYHVEYVRQDGSTAADDVTLGLVFDDGAYLINSEG